MFGLLAAAFPAKAAEHELVTYAPRLQQCYAAAAEARDREACIGVMSGECMSQEEGGETTLGIAFCLQAETQVWDGFLNAEYQATMAWAKATDADERESFPEIATREESLRAAQRAWIAFRDAECALAYAQWGSGSMRTIAGNDCLMEMTADRTIELRNMREAFE